jgi:hypothetical protein
MSACGISVYNHVQSIASATWTINHNLGRKPACEVTILNGGIQEVVLPLSVTYVSDNTTIVTFTSSQTGQVRFA